MSSNSRCIAILDICHQTASFQIIKEVTYLHNDLKHSLEIFLNWYPTRIELLIQNEAFDWKLSNFFTTFSKMAEKVMFYFFANCLGTAWNPY